VDEGLECSWYDRSGRRYRHINLVTFKRPGLTVKETDNRYGYYAYAKRHGFKIIDNYESKHPKRLLLSIADLERITLEKGRSLLNKLEKVESKNGRWCPIQKAQVCCPEIKKSEIDALRTLIEFHN
jgi:hypothetical protein